ncbi:nucleotidyltransferase domain-containing protein [Desulfonatronovibrio magnus]|uniref:nucleotidyltransferase domain-containing protein n=1 Tax=Desulfonatronovibrio magnus TaxID=698827 RepID=UPI0012FA66AE|nr:nucleotidyltransferase domain-containing protein [Desulfonatronovibrio magnus]
MVKDQITGIAKQFALNLVQEISPRKVILYGSWVSGHPGEDSDIDVAVIVDRIDVDYLDLLTRIYQIANNVDTRIEPVLIEENHDPSGFLRHITDHGEIIFSSLPEAFIP